MTTTHEDIDSPALEVGDLWDLVYDLDHTILTSKKQQAMSRLARPSFKALRREVYELDQAIADAFEERRKLLQAIEEQVGDIDWGY